MLANTVTASSRKPSPSTLTSMPDVVSAGAIALALALPALTPSRHANAATARAAIVCL